MSLKTVGLKVPGTCGEWIQTVDQGKECLVSLPINRYTEVHLSLTDVTSAQKSQAILLPKSQQALTKAADYFGISQAWLDQVSVNIIRALDIGKGMASSTADLFGVMLGLSKLFGMEVSIEKLFELCCQIEASDGIMFDQWSLVNHLDGILLERFENALTPELLMLTPDSTFVTESLRGTAQYQHKLKAKTGKPLTLFREAMTTQNLALLGQAATLSLMENEPILEKAHLETLMTLSDEFHCYGVAGGHSGTVSGLILNDQKTDKEALLAKLKTLPLGTYYSDYQFVSAVSGGAEIIFAEA